jgi:hypothetical protein
MTRDQALDIAIKTVKDPIAKHLLEAIKSDCLLADWIILNLLTPEQIGVLTDHLGGMLPQSITVN